MGDDKSLATQLMLAPESARREESSKLRAKALLQNTKVVEKFHYMTQGPGRAAGRTADKAEPASVGTIRQLVLPQRSWS